MEQEKSTFIKLLLYSLGVDIPDFVEEIVKYQFCDWVSVIINTKSDNRYRVMRKLPYADMVMVTPYKDNILQEDEIQIYNMKNIQIFCWMKNSILKKKLHMVMGNMRRFDINLFCVRQL